MCNFVIHNVSTKGKDVVGRLAGNIDSSALGLGIWVGPTPLYTQQLSFCDKSGIGDNELKVMKLDLE
jgi:hypothetical protein